MDGLVEPALVGSVLNAQLDLWGGVGVLLFAFQPAQVDLGEGKFGLEPHTQGDCAIGCVVEGTLELQGGCVDAALEGVLLLGALIREVPVLEFLEVYLPQAKPAAAQVLKLPLPALGVGPHVDHHLALGGQLIV